MEDQMNVHEDKYLHEKITKIIAKQKEGKIVVAATRGEYGLPGREDLGPGLVRAAYPYDYAVGRAGFLKYDPELGAYLLTTKENEKLPAVLAACKPLVLAEAELSIAERRISLQNSETNVTFTNIEPWKGLYQILREVNVELARQNTGIVVWRINPLESSTIQPKGHLFPEAVPKLRNGQALGYVSGYAYDNDQTLAYIGLVGYKTSLESLRVTLMAGKPLLLTQDGPGDTHLIPADKYEQAWQAMPEYTSHHVGFLARSALPGKWEPEDPSAYLLVFQGTPDPKQELIRLFIERIKEALELPILDEWAGSLWNLACRRNFVNNLITGGDCIQGVKLDLQADWKELVTDALAQGEIILAA
jgi:hypothetical protein